MLKKGSSGKSAFQLLKTARALAELDVLSALAETAALGGYTRPRVHEGGGLDIREGRHPVVEQSLRGDRYVPNDVVFEQGEIVRVITGPNMSGKSTYLRLTALVVLMAQIGSFAPADSADIGLVDRIFTPIGAQDEIHAGQSTFMVEMIEAANILHHATSRSLLILDEIGRGTSTYDGLSIAWGMIEYIHNHPHLRAKTLLATHYHELTQRKLILRPIVDEDLLFQRRSKERIARRPPGKITHKDFGDIRRYSSWDLLWPESAFCGWRRKGGLVGRICLPVRQASGPARKKATYPSA